MPPKKSPPTKDKQKTHEELEAELAALRLYNKTEGIVQILNNLIKYGAFVAIAYYAKEAIVALAGKTTMADIGVEVLGSAEISTIAPTLCTVITVMWALGERKLRKDTIQRQADHIKSLELKIDQERTSSRLTIRGDTPQEQKR